MSAPTTTHRIVASWFGTGLLLRRWRDTDAGSGTVASIVTFVPAVWLGLAYGPGAQILAVGVVTALSLWAAHPFADDGHDPGWVVVDEAAGTIVAVVGMTWLPALVGLVVFRLADITKRFPGVRAAERLPGAAGVTADDLVAGFYGFLAAWLVASAL